MELCTALCSYRQHNSQEAFLNYFEQTLQKLCWKTDFHDGGWQRKPPLLRMVQIRITENFCFFSRFILSSQKLINPQGCKSITRTANIFLNNYDINICSGNIISDISDHCNALGNKSKYMPPEKKNKICDYSKFSES